ncbi:MAG: hypothetical protein QNK05_16610 [Myxococcota bacterium]|nr:hypothetical protein [Myxococcota bacterium]
MTRFEFTSVLISIVLGFALSQILASWGRIIRHPHPLAFSWPFALLSLWLTLSLILHWFGLWSYREVPFDRSLHYLIVLAPSFFIALVAHALTPELDGPAPGQLETHYFGTARWLLPLSAASMLAATLSDHLLPGVRVAGPPTYFVLAAVSLVAIGFVRSWWAHVAVLGINTALSVAVLALSHIT